MNFFFNLTVSAHEIKIIGLKFLNLNFVPTKLIFLTFSGLEIKKIGLEFQNFKVFSLCKNKKILFD